MIVIKQLTGISIEIIHEAFLNAFADYVEPINLSLEQLQYMIERRGYDPDLSFGAFDGDELVGFTLNGVDEWNGQLTAYDTGTGVIKEFRKKGIASKMFTESLPILREHKITQYLLEVICSNTPAYDLYKKAGFEVTREHDYYISSRDKIEIKENKLNHEFQVKEIENPDWDLLKTFWDFEPSWQNSIDSLKRKRNHLKILGIFDNNVIAGYAIIEKHTGDIPHLAISRNFRNKGLATTLFKELLNHSKTDVIKIVNTDSAYEPFKEFAKSINLLAGIGQYEMLLQL